MTFTSGALIACLLVVAVLVVVLLRLQRQVAALTTQLSSMTSPGVPTAADPASGAASVAGAGRPETPATAPSSPAPPATAGPPPERVAVITDLAAEPAGVEPGAARIVSVTVGVPLIKVMAFSAGVRRALSEEHRMRVAHAVRKELRHQRKMRRRRRAGRAPSPGWRP